MLNPKKKIVKKELKQDTLMTTVAMTEGFYHENRKMIHYALTGLIVVAVAVVIFINNRRSNNEKAGLELAKVVAVIDESPADASVLKAAIEGRPEQGIMGLKAIVENYGGTDAGEVARFYLGGAYHRIGDFANAFKSFDDFSGGDRMLQAGAKAGAATALEAMKRYPEAAEQFEAALTLDPDGIAAPEYLNSAARCYGLAGDKEEALALLRRLKDDFPKSTYAREADRAIVRYSL